ncbi:MAG: ribonuclease P protein component [Bdellovibrionales bacterium]|nr:ribonuclease P protein component [Bdellovibrionales bacterium]
MSPRQIGDRRQKPSLDRRLGPARRIKKRRDFLAIQQGGKRVRSKHFVVAYRQLERQPESGAFPESRIGITITRKVDKRAVGRNRVKRRVREFFRLFRHRLSFAADIVVVALSGSTNLTTEEIQRELGGVFRRAGLFPQRAPRRQTQPHEET